MPLAVKSGWLYLRPMHNHPGAWCDWMAAQFGPDFQLIIPTFADPETDELGVKIAVAVAYEAKGVETPPALDGYRTRAEDGRRARAALGSVPSPAGEARRTLRDYAQHDAGCAKMRCRFVYGPTNRCDQPEDSTDHDPDVWPEDAHKFLTGRCTCGLDALLAADPLPAEEGKEKP